MLNKRAPLLFLCRTDGKILRDYQCLAPEVAEAEAGHKVVVTGCAEDTAWSYDSATRLLQVGCDWSAVLSAHL